MAQRPIRYCETLAETKHGFAAGMASGDAQVDGVAALRQDRRVVVDEEREDLIRAACAFELAPEGLRAEIEPPLGVRHEGIRWAVKSESVWSSRWS